jgi:hypothetical protein
MGLRVVACLAERFGSSLEATVFRLATASEHVAVAGLLRYRLKKDGQRAIASAVQRSLFRDVDEAPAFVPKYRRQSLHLSRNATSAHTIPWNKSFDPESCVYRAAQADHILYGRESLPNRAKAIGNIEAVRAPYQRPAADADHGDVLFLWWQ